MTKRKLAGSEEAMVHPRQEDAQKARKMYSRNNEQNTRKEKVRAGQLYSEDHRRPCTDRQRLTF